MNTTTLTIALITLASAASADCLSIKAYDLRQACLAQARQDPRDCTSVKDWDAREVCRMRAGERDMWGEGAPNVVGCWM